MTTMAPQITSLTVVYSTVYSDADQRKHQSSASLAFVWGIHRDRWIPRTKVQLRGICVHLMTSSWYYGHETGIHSIVFVYHEILILSNISLSNVLDNIDNREIDHRITEGIFPAGKEKIAKMQYVEVKWPSRCFELPINRVFAQQFVQTNNKETSKANKQQRSALVQCERKAMTSQWITGWIRHILRRQCRHVAHNFLISSKVFFI